MFANAVDNSMKFTKPVIYSVRHYDGSVNSGLASYFILNDEGWVITCAHVISALIAERDHKNHIEQHEEARKAIEQNTKLKSKEKKRRIKQLKKDDKWVTHAAFLFGKTNWKIVQYIYHSEIDLAVCRLDPFETDFFESTYPVLKRPDIGMRPGTNLCRLGFPFNKVKTSFNDTSGEFKLHSYEAPYFPNEGIYTRDILGGKTKDDDFEIRFLETSSAGIRGQSGGPIFDIKGTVWAIQAKTKHLDLDFAPSVLMEGKKGQQTKKEHQFLNVGWGVHPRVITAFLDKHNIKYQLSDY